MYSLSEICFPKYSVYVSRLKNGGVVTEEEVGSVVAYKRRKALGIAENKWDLIRDVLILSIYELCLYICSLLDFIQNIMRLEV